MNFSGRSIVVVGASSGIGRAVAVALGRAGARVGLFARRGEALVAVAQEIESEGGTAVWVAGDTRKSADVERALARFTEEGPVDGLVWMAGVSHVTQPREISADEFRDLLEVNTLGFVRWVEVLLPDMIARREGFLAGCTALCAYRGMPAGAEYAASKAALKAYLEGLHLDLEPYGVRVFQLMPGFVETPMSDLNNFTQPFMISAEAGAEQVLEGLRADRFRIEFGPGMSRLMRFLRWLPDWAYQLLFRDFTYRRHALEELLARMPGFRCPECDGPVPPDRYGVFHCPEDGHELRFWRDSFDVLQPVEARRDAAVVKLTAAYRLYALTYPVTAFLAMTFVWRGTLGPLVSHYAETLRRAGEDRAMLDVATGDGALLSLALRAAGEKPWIFSVDLSPDMVRRASKRLRGYLRKLFYIRDVGELDLPEASFTHAAVYGGFHVFPDPVAALRRIRTVLEPDGEVAGSILTRPTNGWAAAAARRFIGWGQLSNSMTEAEVDAAFADAGLEFTSKVWNGHMLLFRARPCR